MAVESHFDCKEKEYFGGLKPLNGLSAGKCETASLHVRFMILQTPSPSPPSNQISTDDMIETREHQVVLSPLPVLSQPNVPSPINTPVQSNSNDSVGLNDIFESDEQQMQDEEAFLNSEMHLIYGECGGIARRAAALYRERFPRARLHPDYRVFIRLHNAYVEGRIPGQRGGEGRPRLDNDDDVLDEIEDDPSTSVIGPFELPENLNGANYLHFLQNDLPVLLEDLNLAQRVTMWYQNDGCPAHYDTRVRDHLNNIFPARWIGRLGPILWPPRSPDLNPLDFYYWGVFKRESL
ncbi:hypothetical protein EVAR_48026_1 [Eumeta japonica]|uniref:DUF4817 domain-containing protein n=1 Tax=Eumeta variegata TaxID=151549 RepID=A0A4C1XT02_EUMVA|nr:hypothetical protein EVAR_48026_1 [Eumeta japonica]